MKSQPIQNSADASLSWFYNTVLMILRVERCDDVFMKSMKILILHKFFHDFSENPAAVNYQPGARQATSGPRERETKQEPFADGFRE